MSINIDSLDKVMAELLAAGSNTEQATRILDSQRTSNLVDLRAPLYGDKDISREVLINLAIPLAKTGILPLDELEEKETGKIGPVSPRVDYASRAESVYEYFSNKSIKPVQSSFRYAIKQVQNLVKRQIRALSLVNAYAVMPRGTNLGLPNLDKTSGEDYLDMAMELDRNDYPLDRYMWPSMLFWRGQANGTPIPKQRNVWGMSHVETILGLSILHPVLSVLKPNPSFAAWNELAVVDQVITGIMKQDGGHIISLDFSAFDQSISSELIHAAFDILREWFGRREYSKLLWLETNFRTVSLLTPEGLITGRDGSVPSGSALTNLIDSLVQLIAISYVEDRLRLNLVSVTVLGDDGVVKFATSPDTNLISDIFSELGLKMNPEKSSVSISEVSFLQRLHTFDVNINGTYPGIRSFMRAWGSCMSYERLRPDWDTNWTSVAWIMKVNNCEFHPKFSLLVELLYNADDNLRSEDPSSLFSKLGGLKRVEDYLGYSAFPYTQNLESGLARFATVVELRRLRATRPVLRFRPTMKQVVSAT